MMKRAYLTLILLFACLTADCSEKKYTLSACAVFRNEALYMQEWIEYHRLIGVEHFYLYNNESNDEFEQVLQPYIEMGIVTLFDWPDQPSSLSEKKPFRWVYATQVPACEHAIKYSMEETKWLAMIDLDEYILPMQTMNFIEVLDAYEEYPGITLKWHIYGTSYLETIPPDQLLIEALHRTYPPNHPLNMFMMKSIVKPELYARFTLAPHDCHYKNKRLAKPVPKRIARINHYMMRCEAYLKTKIQNRERGMNRKCTPQEIEDLYHQGNEVEDQKRSILRFAPQLRQLVHLEGCQ
jgi:hypothetical protein